MKKKTFTSKQILFILTLLSITYIFINKKITFSIETSFQVYTFEKNNQNKKKELPLCTKVEESIRGSWVIRKDSTGVEREKRYKKDADIRARENWPAVMYRNDTRCGKQYPIPGYRLQGQCDPDSTTPCCNQDLGTCGIGSSFCECPSCTDLRTMVPAELADWTPLTCRVKLFNQMDICNLLGNFNLRLAFIGDSLIRHLHTMMVLMLTGDFEEGSIPVNATQKKRDLCRGEHQITDKKCSVEVVAQSTSEIKQSTICFGKYNNIKIDLVQDYHTTLISNVKNKIDELFEQENSWIIGGVGLHYQLNFELIKREYMDKVWTKLQSSKNGWPKLLWIGIHGTFGFLRLEAGPINKNVDEFNEKVKEYWISRNVTVIDTFGMSEGIRSYDGRHYGFGFNKLKIQLILNYLQQYQKSQTNVLPELRGSQRS